jgi:hypothetical protein
MVQISYEIRKKNDNRYELVSVVPCNFDPNKKAINFIREGSLDICTETMLALMAKRAAANNC